MRTKFKILLIALFVFLSIILSIILFKKYISNSYKNSSSITIENTKEEDFESVFNHAIKESNKISNTLWDEKYNNIKIKDKYKVVFVTTGGGEYNYAECFKYAADRLGWEVMVYSDQIKTFYKEVLDFDPDFILYAVGADHYINSPLKAHRSKKYLNNHTLLSVLRGYGMINKENPYMTDGALSLMQFHAVLALPGEVDVFQQIFANLNKDFNGLAVLPFTPSTDYAPAEPKNLMWCGTGWDKFRSSTNYKEFITLLSKNLPMKVYGPYSNLNYLPLGVYDGFTPSGMEQINAIRKNGIYLLTHADLYISSGIPTSRIFEALAANAVIISDKHPFAIENFGDNFLYFDQNADAQIMYEQVKAHMDWILANPEKAKAMAAKAHQIFLEKFTVENDLIRIAKMHEYIILQEKKMGLRYPLAY